MHMGAVVTAASVHEAQSSRRYSTLTTAIGSLDLDLIEAKRSYYSRTEHDAGMDGLMDLRPESKDPGGFDLSGADSTFPPSRPLHSWRQIG